MNTDSLPNDNEPISAPDPVTRGQKNTPTPENEKKCRVSVDYLSVTYHPPSSLSRRQEIHYRRSVIEEISDVLRGAPGDWIEQEHGFKSYRRSLKGPGSAQLNFDPRNGSDFNLSLSGEACRLAGTELLRMFVNSFVGVGAKARRVDLALDDYEKRITPERFFEEIRGPNKVAHSQKALKVTGVELGKPDTGDTVYLGSTKSGRRLRVYDKYSESKGLIDAIRWELQERRRAAEKAAHDLANGDWNEVVRRRLVGFVDFKYRESAPRIQDRKRWEPYQELMEGAKKADAYLPAEDKTMKEVEDRFVKQYGPTLAMLFLYHGGDLSVIAEYARNGMKRLRPKHRALIARSKKKY